MVIIANQIWISDVENIKKVTRKRLLFIKTLNFTIRIRNCNVNITAVNTSDIESATMSFNLEDRVSTIVINILSELTRIA